MNSNSTTTISKSEALQQTINWDYFRSDLSLVRQLFFQAGFNCFQIGPDFDPDQFGGKAHAYFGVRVDYVEGEVNMRLNLLIIPGEQDNDTHESPYIYCAPFLAGNLEAMHNTTPSENQQQLIAMEERWANEGENWLETVVGTDDGMTQVSDVPLQDISTEFDFENNLYVYFGLHHHEVPHKELALLFYDGNSGHFLDLEGADFTTPKPPFGTDKADYSLVHDIP